MTSADTRVIECQFGHSELLIVMYQQKVHTMRLYFDMSFKTVHSAKVKLCHGLNEVVVE